VRRNGTEDVHGEREPLSDLARKRKGVISGPTTQIKGVFLARTIAILECSSVIFRTAFRLKVSLYDERLGAIRLVPLLERYSRRVPYTWLSAFQKCSDNMACSVCFDFHELTKCVCPQHQGLVAIERPLLASIAVFAVRRLGYSLYRRKNSGREYREQVALLPGPL
jgi:hypothetical protein